MPSKFSLFTLQGLGNSILAIPVVLSLKSQFQVTLYLINEPAYRLYSDLNLGIELVFIKNLGELFTKKLDKSDIAMSLYPNWKRELFALCRCPARQKIFFEYDSFMLKYFLKGTKIHREEIHDIENNFKALEVLGLPSTYPDLAGFFPLAKHNTVVLHPTASTPYKYYPKAFWAELINYLVRQNFQVFIFSGNTEYEKDFCNGIIRSTGLTTNIRYHAGMRLIDVAKHIAGSRVFIGSDSALMHLAGLLDVFTVALWSFADFRRVYPYGNHSHVYIPEEVLEAQAFFCSTRTPALINRAGVQDIIEIIQAAKKETFVLSPRFKSPVKFYKY